MLVMDSVVIWFFCEGKLACYLVKTLIPIGKIERSMNIEEVSRKIYHFQKKRVTELGGELTPELVFLHLSEEIGEIARQLVNKNLPYRRYEENNLKEEITQAILDLLVLSEVFNVNLSETIARKMDEMAQRGQVSS